MISQITVSATWDLPAIASASGAPPAPDPLNSPFWFLSNDDGTGNGVLFVAGVTQEALDAALAAWLEANPQ
jgi:hypothetical protein